MFQQESHFSLNLVHINAERAKVIDLTFPLTIWYSRATVRRGSPEVHPWGFVFPLGTEVWLTILTSLLGVVAIMTALMLCLPGKMDFCAMFLANADPCARVILQQGRTW